MTYKFEKLPHFTVIRDTYTVDSVLGEGAFGVVYKVRHKFLGIQALKVFHPERISEKLVVDFLNEAVILSKITHPNVVRVFEANHFEWKDKNISYVAMEYIPGGTLDDYLRKKNRLAPALALRIQTMICRGLAQAHQLSVPVIHRDVKPQNIMLDMAGENIVVKVSDFGQAKHADPLTKLAESAGTLAYMAPEGFWNYKSPASDVYSAGMILYIMLTGVSPFKMPEGGPYKNPKDIERLIRKTRSGPVKPPSVFNADIDRELDVIVLKALEKNAEDRYADAKEFLAALKDYAAFDGAAFKKRMNDILVRGRQYRDLPEAIEDMEDVFKGLPEDQRKAFRERYGKFLDSWKKGIIM